MGSNAYIGLGSMVWVQYISLLKVYTRKCLFTFLVLLVFASVVLADPGKKDVASKDKNSVKVASDKQNKGLKRKSKTKKGKARSRRKRRRKSKKAKTRKDKKDGRRKGQKRGKKDHDKMKQGKRIGRRRKLKTQRMEARCRNVTCLNDMLKVLKINKDTVRNFLKQEKRLMGR